MKKIYEKPEAELLKFQLMEAITEGEENGYDGLKGSESDGLW